MGKNSLGIAGGHCFRAGPSSSGTDQLSKQDFLEFINKMTDPEASNLQQVLKDRLWCGGNKYGQNPDGTLNTQNLSEAMPSHFSRQVTDTDKDKRQPLHHYIPDSILDRLTNDEDLRSWSKLNTELPQGTIDDVILKVITEDLVSYRKSYE